MGMNIFKDVLVENLHTPKNYTGHSLQLRVCLALTFTLDLFSLNHKKTAAHLGNKSDFLLQVIKLAAPIDAAVTVCAKCVKVTQLNALFKMISEPW